MYDVLNNAHGWIVWNLLVNHAGGPNHLDNYCDAPLVATENSDGFTEQPQLLYLAAFSKFVPPGSRRVLSEVRGDFGFAAGDPSIQPGLELGMYPCESSGRQQFFFNGTNPSLETPISINPDSQGEQGSTFRLCVAPGQGGDFRDYVRLIECDISVDPFLKPRVVVVGINHKDDDDADDDNAMARAAAHLVNIVDETTGACLSIADGQTGIGALMLMEKCGTDEKSEVRQQFHWTSNGELVAHALYATDYCVTSGSPLLSAVAFRDPSEQTVVVLMNEADAATRITVKDDAGAEILFASPAHSIQSLVFSNTDV
jgi:glucosylceramidase